MGPLHDAIQVLTYNSSQPAHIPRTPPLSIALVHQLHRLGVVANEWESIYPLEKWSEHPTLRRQLHSHERYRLRRAVYRIWHYTQAFHNPSYISGYHARPHPAYPDDPRLFLLHNYSTAELSEIVDILIIFRNVLSDLFPSDAMIQKRYTESFPNAGPLYFGTYETYPTQPGHGYTQAHFRGLGQKMVEEAWGAWNNQARLVEGLMKLDPSRILRLREETTSKRERIEWLAVDLEACGWSQDLVVMGSFSGNGATMGDAIDIVLADRESWIDVEGEEGGIVAAL
jgi:hypothetical protein